MTELTPSQFTHRDVPILGRKLHRLGIACNYGVDERGFDRAIERGVEYVFWSGLRTGAVEPALKRALASKRDRIVLGAGPTVGGPSSIAQVDENLDALDRGPLSADEQKWMRAFGSAVHG